MKHLLLESTDVVLVTVYYLVFGFLASLAINHVLEVLDDQESKDENRSTARLGLEIMIHVLVLALVFYFLRVLIRAIPFPWDGRRGYDHSSLYEIDGGIVLVVVILFFQRRLIEKVGTFQNRVRELLGYDDVADA
jgi:hypothetical protein